jgi:uncharacterized phage protein gp47/JayE
MYDYIEQTGVIVSDTSDILEEVESEYKTAFNDESLVTTPDTPQGALITTETIGRTSLQNNNANLANQINPEIAGGIFLDAIGALTDTNRTESTATTVTATITGQSGTLVTAGSIAKSGDNEFSLVSDTTIPVSGTIDTIFQSVVLGAIPCLANTLTQIESEVLGWETIDNAAAGVLGLEEESDTVFRRFRKETLAKQGVAIPFAIKSNLRLVEGVKSLSFLENYENTTEIIENISLVPHSIFACIDGGSDEDIAFALYDSKTLGANYNGDVIVEINPPDSDAPYTVKFKRPDLIDIYINITVKVTGTGQDPVTTVTNAILNYANGLTEEAGFSVGNNVSAFELSASISSQTGFFVSIVETSLDDISYDSLTKTIELDEKAQTFENFITVTVQ